ncbi:MAG TPA: FMN-binding negative transcriptional regulator [Noviherbaspirillum sp.]|uniref:FMN-binding negative transcriptional regulator n=1 Tax=Noviherbaspirillum sp. TaxID=1926288 RepID=UPI002B4A319A|nr:FMN-binding negative transcriptional regulator [Noviherbaspirillum sp.]HJV85855.1 FMN-binding negative transcriptional regulator [Noviherbaspirillum sp.]
MYIPKQFEETRQEVLHGLMKAHPLATLVVAGESGLVVNHIPLQVCGSEGEFGILRGHMARANPMWRQLAGAAEAVAIFQGPDSYITPSWYPSKHVDGKAVPTWNYAVVHAHGRPRVVEDAAWLLNHLTAMTDEQENGEALPWKVADAPRDFIEQMMSAIVGIEISIVRLEGKWKVSQNRPAQDREGVVAALHERGDDRSLAMAELVVQYGSASAKR